MTQGWAIVAAAILGPMVTTALGVLIALAFHNKADLAEIHRLTNSTLTTANRLADEQGAKIIDLLDENATLKAALAALQQPEES